MVSVLKCQAKQVTGSIPLLAEVVIWNIPNKNKSALILFPFYMDYFKVKRMEGKCLLCSMNIFANGSQFWFECVENNDKKKKGFKWKKTPKTEVGRRTEGTCRFILDNLDILLYVESVRILSTSI